MGSVMMTPASLNGRRFPRKVCILDTDLGRDIDDAWALAFLLKLPELDLRLVTTSTGDTIERAAIARRLLLAAGRDDVAVAAGKAVACGNDVLQHELVSDREREQEYPDAAAAVARLVLARAPEPTTVIGIAPLSNLAELAVRHPRATGWIDLVLMAGSLGLDGGDRVPEWNIKCDIPAAQKVFSADWRSVTVTTLDSCGKVCLTGNYLRKLERHPGLLERELGRHYRAWLHAYGWNDGGNLGTSGIPERQTSTLYDTVAVHLAAGGKYLHLETKKLAIDGQGRMAENAENGIAASVATKWLDLEGYRRYLSEVILTAPTGKGGGAR